MKIRAGELNRKARKGYIGHVIVICQNVLEKSNINAAINDLS